MRLEHPGAGQLHCSPDVSLSELPAQRALCQHAIRGAGEAQLRFMLREASGVGRAAAGPAAPQSGVAGPEIAPAEHVIENVLQEEASEAGREDKQRHVSR